MKMKMSNGQMTTYVTIMTKLKEEKKLAYAIARNTRILKDATKEFDDFRVALYEKYGKIDPKTGAASVFPENEDAFLEEIKELSEIEHEVEVFTVPVDVFINGNMDNNQMEALMWMVEKPKNETKEDTTDG